MTKKIISFLICVVLAFSLFSVGAYACGQCITIHPTKSATVSTDSGDGINLRRYHSTSSDAIGVLEDGGAMNLDRQYDGTDYDWYHGVVTYSKNSNAVGLVGWAAGRFLNIVQ